MEKEKLQDLRENIPTLQGIITYTENITALKVFNMKILQQSTTGNFGSKETLFRWHKDNEDRKKNAKLSVIILLLSTKSSMQIMNKEKCSYKRQGTAIAFPSGLFHRSVQADEHTMKLFFSRIHFPFSIYVQASELQEIKERK